MPHILRSRYFLFWLICAVVFLCLKLPHTTIRMSDSNIYFYNAYQILQGQVLYKDIFFTNFPMVPYISSLYFLLLNGNLHLYYVTPIIESLCVSFFVFLIARKRVQYELFALCAALLYLFSFIVLSTTDHQTGVFIASLFSIISYYFFDSKRMILAGIFVACAVMTKAYFLPLALTYGIFLLYHRRIKDLMTISISGGVTILFVVLPSLLLARQEFFKDVIQYSLTRGAGLSKVNILWFFVLHDVVLSAIVVTNIFLFKKHVFFSIFSILSLIFILLYQDVYYLYLNFMLPILAVSSAHLFEGLSKKLKLQLLIVPTILLVFMIVSIFLYSVKYSRLQTIPNLPKLINDINTLNPHVLYGTNDITPALSYLTDTPMLNNITDTNTNIFRKKLLNAKDLTTQAVAQKGVIITHGLYYPEYGINKPNAEEIIDDKILEKSCKLIQRYPVISEGYVNQLNILKCF